MEMNSEVSINQKVIDFFQQNDLFDHLVTRQLSHIKGNWELIWDHHNKRYKPEEDSFAKMINDLVVEISKLRPPSKYHDNEDRAIEICKAFSKLNFIEKKGNRWVGGDYAWILEQAGLYDINDGDLCLAMSGRVKAALDRGQIHFDDMEESHRKMLADIIAIILFHRERQKQSN
jgi:hypothetical protein